MTCLVETAARQRFNQNVCRLCVQTDETLWNIFEASDDNSNLNLPEKILHCLNIMVEVNDGLPDQVCGKCMTVVRCFYEYRQDCLQHDKELRESLHNLCRYDLLKSGAIIGELPEEGCEEVENDPLDTEPVPDKECSISKRASAEDSHSNSDSIIKEETEMNWTDAPIVLQLKEDWCEDEESSDCTQVSSKEKELPWRLFGIGDDDNSNENSIVKPHNVFTSEVSHDMFAGRISRKASGMWVCNLCDEEYKVLATMKRHITRHYSRVSNQCLDCQISFKSVEELDLHKDQHRSSSLVVGHTCELCYKTFQLGHLLQRHIGFEHNGIDKRVTAPKKFRVTCGKCVRVFYCSTEMENHNESCGESVDGEESEADSSEENYRPKQSRPKYGVRVWPCYLCNLIFDNVRQLTFHFQRDHEGHKPFKCDVSGCEKLLEKWRQLDDHRSREHGPGFPCEICKKVFKENSKYKDHLKVHQGGKSYKCVLCKQSFRTSRDLCKHKKRHIKPLKCDDCGKRFGAKYDLTRHLAQVHSHKKDSICDRCGKAFAHADNLGQHKQSCLKQKKRHLKPLKCDECDERFGTKYDLTQHLAQVHSHKKDFICDRCGKAFAHADNLGRHKKICRSKTFKCKVCEKEISTSIRNFQIHENHCGTDNIKSCQLCGIQYSRLSSLNRHMKDVHKK